VIYYITGTAHSRRLRPLLKASLDEAISLMPDLLHDDSVEIKVFIRPDRNSVAYSYDPMIDYEVFINEMQADDEIVRSVYHEMKHVEQLYHGRMEFVNNTRFRWKGRDWGHVDEISNLTDSVYRRLPWEREANVFEQEANKLLYKLDQRGKIQTWHDKKRMLSCSSSLELA